MRTGSRGRQCCSSAAYLKWNPAAREKLESTRRLLFSFKRYVNCAHCGSICDKVEHCIFALILVKEESVLVMRSRIRRHLGALLGGSPPHHIAAKGIADAFADRQIVPSEFNPRQYAILLLQVAASIEHALMIEYLYAAHSLGGSGVSTSHQTEVAQWREIILGIAKEEMGHLMTIQNILRCVGGPLSLEREDYPWDSEFYPFPFRLEPLTRQSLAKFVYSESPAPDIFTGPEANEILTLALQGAGNGTVHRVGALYSRLELLFKDSELIPDSAFREETFPFQANWDEWGRGYQAGARGSAMGGAMPQTPNLLILPVTARTDVLNALDQVATQGEANPTADDSAPSHFARFLRIFREFPHDGSWSPTRDVAINPVVVDQNGSIAHEHESTIITHQEAMKWAHLLNLRYRLLLVNLLHSFEYPSNLSENSQFTPRGLLIHSTFGEMYNLRALTEILMQTPLSPGSSQFAGPPFQMPYTMRLPVDGVDKWNVHLDLLETSRELMDELQYDGQKHGAYLRALKEADSQVSSSIQSISGNLRRFTAYTKCLNPKG